MPEQVDELDLAGLGVGDGDGVDVVGVDVLPAEQVVLVDVRLRPADDELAERAELVSRNAGLAFPVRDGIPVLLVSEARPL